MAQKLTDRTELAEAPASGDFLHVVDVSDTTDSAQGTSKKVQAQYLTIADASTTVKGKVELATDAETTAGTDTTRATTPSNILAVMKLLNPIGTIREFNVSTNPGTLLGFGTWSAYGTGRFTIAIDAGDATIDTVDETGGSKTVTIGQTNLPNISTGAGTAHSHGVTDPTHRHSAVADPGTDSATGNFRTDSGSGNTNYTEYSATGISINNESAHTHSLGGSGTALNVMNPFITVYRWVRTA